SVWVAGFGSYFIAYFVFRFIDPFRPYLPGGTIGGFLLVTMTMFMTNRSRLKTATLSREKEPPANREVKNKNRLYGIIKLAFVFMLTNAHIIQETLWNGLRKLVHWFSNIQSSSDGELVEDPSPSPAQDPQLPFDDKESGAIAKVLENIVMYAMYILLVLGA